MLGDISACAFAADALPDGKGEEWMPVSGSKYDVLFRFSEDHLGILPISCMLALSPLELFFSLLDDFCFFLTTAGFTAGEPGTADAGSVRSESSV